MPQLSLMDKQELGKHILWKDFHLNIIIQILELFQEQLMKYSHIFKIVKKNK